jgi:hypothetical protein
VFNASRACELLVALPAVNVLDIVEPLVGRREVTIESVVGVPGTGFAEPLGQLCSDTKTTVKTTAACQRTMVRCPTGVP